MRHNLALVMIPFHNKYMNRNNLIGWVYVRMAALQNQSFKWNDRLYMRYSAPTYYLFYVSLEISWKQMNIIRSFQKIQLGGSANLVIRSISKTHPKEVTYDCSIVRIRSPWKLANIQSALPAMAIASKRSVPRGQFMLFQLWWSAIEPTRESVTAEKARKSGLKRQWKGVCRPIFRLVGQQRSSCGELANFARAFRFHCHRTTSTQHRRSLVYSLNATRQSVLSSLGPLTLGRILSSFVNVRFFGTTFCSALLLILLSVIVQYACPFNVDSLFSVRCVLVY